MTALPSLAPCPFCGGTAERRHPDHPHGGMVTCVCCGAEAFGPKWNRRSDAALEVIIERLAEAETILSERNDELALIDWISEQIGLPHDEELTRENFAAAWNRRAAPVAANMRDLTPDEAKHLRSALEASSELLYPIAPALPSQEDVARVIDPLPWDHPEWLNSARVEPCKNAALSKAAAILALMGQRGDGWLPIEGAPKDGTDILFWSEAEGAQIGYWCTSIWVHPGAWVAEENRSDTTTYSPTHWRPLPAPPAKEPRP